MHSKSLRISRRRSWCLADSYNFIASYMIRTYSRPIHVAAASQNRNIRQTLPALSRPSPRRTHRTSNSKSHHPIYQRNFHNYFVTNLLSPSLHDARSSLESHQLARSTLTSHQSGFDDSPDAAPSTRGAPHELTVARISLQSAKKHFGAAQSRGTRPANEDTYQAGTLEIPAFAKRAPISLSRSAKSLNGADSASGDPQVFYFGVFDGHGGNECSAFLRDNLHLYLERSANLFEIKSSLQKNRLPGSLFHQPYSDAKTKENDDIKIQQKGNDQTKYTLTQENAALQLEALSILGRENSKSSSEDVSVMPGITIRDAMVKEWRETVGGYFRRFKPGFFDSSNQPIAIESVLMYAFLRADLDFISAQAQKQPKIDSKIHDQASLVIPTDCQIGGPTRFTGGSTGSIALISTPTPTPFWHPDSPSTMLIAHVGDTRIILCNTATGLAQACTTNHHPSAPSESNRLRRYATTFVTDSFGEERMSGLANTRSFGDMHHKRIGVSAEPEIQRLELAPAEYSMLVLVSDGVSGTLSDQEIVDVVKEAKTPEQGAEDVVSFATEVSRNGDNATCLVVRLGGWERRGEGGLGSLGTKERRDWRSGDAGDMRKADGLW